MSSQRGSQNGNNSESSTYKKWLWGGMAAVAAGLGAYYVTRSSEPAQSQRHETNSNSASASDDSINWVTAAIEPIPRVNPVMNNMNALLDDIYVRFIALRDEDFDKYYGVLTEILDKLQKEMKEVDPYYNKYSSRKQFAGSHFDRLRIKKPDEFDLDIVIGLPLSFRAGPEPDIAIEPKVSGFVQLRMGTQFKRLPYRDGWQINRTAYDWCDDRTDYLLRSKFIDWFKSVLARALDRFASTGDGKRMVYIRGVEYQLSRSESGPALTLYVESKRHGFKLDVDLVPALKFPEERWPICRGYRAVPPGCSREDFMVVPKPIRNGSSLDETRSWRLALHDQEKRLMHGLENCRQAIRLMKKLRDSREMSKISSYYIKNLFLLKIVEVSDAAYWRNNPAFLFKVMVRALHDRLVEGNIPYFWNKSNNLIAAVDRSILRRYASKLQELMAIMEQPARYKEVAKYLLTDQEYVEYSVQYLRL